MKEKNNTSLFWTEEDEKYERKGACMRECLSEALQHALEFVDYCEEMEEIHGYIQDFISAYHKKDPDFLEQTVSDHFYVRKTKQHYYVTGSFKHYYFGYLVDEFGTVTSSTEPRCKWSRFRCKEDCAVPRTMADVLKEYD